MIIGSEHSSKHDLYLKRYLKDGVARVMGKNRELPARMKDGLSFPVELGLGEIISDSGDRLFCGFVRDLRKQKSYENELKQREQFTNKIIESSRDGILVISPEGNIIKANVAAVKMFGRSMDDLLSRQLGELLLNDDSAVVCGELSQYNAIRIPLTPQREATALDIDGSPFPINLTLAEIEDFDRSCLFACFVTDLTERKRLMKVEIEKTAAEVLLMNVLPEQIATRLLGNPQHIAESHKCAAILFADIVGFTGKNDGLQWPPLSLMKLTQCNSQ
jgi:PAS domain S-box-containing protein